MPIEAKGRMITTDIAYSLGFASLSKDAAILFCMMIPQLNSRGKMNGEPDYIKAVVCPRVDYLTVEIIPFLLREISDKTNVKWYKVNDRRFIHSLKFLKEHQKLRTDRLGIDHIPDYPGAEVRDLSGSTPGGVQREVKGSEVEVDLKDQDQNQPLTPETDEVYIAKVKEFYNTLMEADDARLIDWRKNYGDALNVDACLFAATTWLAENARNRKKNIIRFYGNWLRNQYTRATAPRTR